MERLARMQSSAKARQLEDKIDEIGSWCWTSDVNILLLTYTYSKSLVNEAATDDHQMWTDKLLAKILVNTDDN